jgi:hypothetical protein
MMLRCAARSRRIASALQAVHRIELRHLLDPNVKPGA